MRRLLVVGGASSDTLRLDTVTTASPGGAGMYTAMGAQRCGAKVSLFAPRPEPMPEILVPVAARLQEWLGPAVPPEDLPHFDISHRDGRTEYLEAVFGAESGLDVSMLPNDVSAYDAVHVIPLGDARKQLAFIEACLERGARRVSAGTYLGDIRAAPDVVRTILGIADWFFLNESEAVELFGSIDGARAAPGRVLFVTRGPLGARVLQGAHGTDVAGVEAHELDPTGAGDTFCGATLAFVLDGAHPVVAAQRAAAVAAEEVTKIGPAALLSYGALPGPRRDARVRVDAARVERVAGLIAGLDQVMPFDFVAPELPAPGHPAAIDFFFATTLQQFGFWTHSEGTYERPLLAAQGGVARKGAFYLFEAYRRRLEVDPGFCEPTRQEALTLPELRDTFRGDDGSDPMPAIELHLELANQYGRDLAALGLTPKGILGIANASTRPLHTLLGLLDRIGGYKEDPLRKKATLLALILAQRPERFLRFGDAEVADPVIDYHLMRSCLRVGLVDIIDAGLRCRVERRELLDVSDEWAIRTRAYEAVEAVVALSGRTIGAVDWFFFGARSRCPEMTEPQCDRCSIDTVCAHRTELFQPVIRTTFY